MRNIDPIPLNPSFQHAIIPSLLWRFGFLRRIVLRLTGVMLAKMDRANREYRLSYDNALTNLKSRVTVTSEMELEAALKVFEPGPKLVEVLQLLLEERDLRSALDRKTLAKIQFVNLQFRCNRPRFR